VLFDLNGFAGHTKGEAKPRPRIDRPRPFLQADQLVHDEKNNRVIAHGNVEVHHNDCVLTADELVLDRTLKTLVATGNVQLKDTNGAITRPTGSRSPTACARHSRPARSDLLAGRFPGPHGTQKSGLTLDI
jgi:LptA/(LptD N-terminal domain) LPS transport protein